MMELGGNITLSGFSEREFTELIVVKKIVGQYARKFSDTVQGFEGLRLTLKEVHGGSKVEINAHARAAGHEYLGESIDHNLFVALDNSLKHVEEQLRRAKT